MKERLRIDSKITLLQLCRSEMQEIFAQSPSTEINFSFSFDEKFNANEIPLQS